MLVATTTKIRLTALKPLPKRQRVTRLREVEFQPAAQQLDSRLKTVAIPFLIGRATKQIEIKLAQSKAKKPIDIVTPEPGLRKGKILGGPVQSSNASAVWYYPLTLLMVINFHDGAEYEYYDVQFDLFNYVYNGLGVAKTDGQNQYGRWWKGKSNPSVGASIWQRLRGGGLRYKRVR